MRILLTLPALLVLQEESSFVSSFCPNKLLGSRSRVFGAQGASRRSAAHWDPLGNDAYRTGTDLTSAPNGAESEPLSPNVQVNAPVLASPQSRSVVGGMNPADVRFWDSDPSITELEVGFFKDALPPKHVPKTRTDSPPARGVFKDMLPPKTVYEAKTATLPASTAAPPSVKPPVTSTETTPAVPTPDPEPARVEEKQEIAMDASSPAVVDVPDSAPIEPEPPVVKKQVSSEAPADPYLAAAEMQKKQEVKAAADIAPPKKAEPVQQQPKAVKGKTDNAPKAPVAKAATKSAPKTAEPGMVSKFVAKAAAPKAAAGPPKAKAKAAPKASQPSMVSKFAKAASKKNGPPKTGPKGADEDSFSI